MRGVRWYLVGSLVLLVLAGCARQAWFGEREPWRREAEMACLKSGAVREGPTVALLKPIQGPGMCGADFPLKIGALGEAPIAGYPDDMTRPPGAIPQNSAYPRPVATGSSAPVYAPNAPAPYQPDPLYTPAPDPYPYNAAPRSVPANAPGAPLSLAPPGLESGQSPRPAPRLEQGTGSFSGPATPVPSYGAPPLGPAR